MTWITWAISIIRTQAGRYAAIALAVLAGLGLARAKWISEGEDKAERRARDDADERVEKGRDRLRDGRGDDPDERLRRNDGNWR